MDVKTLFVIITGVLLVVLIVIELFAPARTYTKQQKINSYFTNTLIFISNNIITVLLQVSAVFAVVLTWSPSATFFQSLPTGVQFVAGLLILDLTIWLWHRLNHIIPFLWAFHKCHHSETYLNASSALRFHIGELLLSVIWKSAVLITFGIPLWVFVISESLLTLFAMFHHTNMKLSPKVRTYTEMIIITPYLHRVHHSDIRSEHDSNYGVILSVWDRLFGTLQKVVPARIGLKEVNDKNIFSFLIFPFLKK